MKYIGKKPHNSQVPLVKIITLWGYEVYTVRSQYNPISYQHSGNLIWIKTPKDGDYIVAKYEENKPFYKEISVFIKERLPYIGGYDYFTNVSIVDIMKADYIESAYYAAINRDYQEQASFNICKNNACEINGYSTRLDFYNVKALDLNALRNLYLFAQRQMEDNHLLQDCCFSYQVNDGDQDFFKELDFHPQLREDGVYYKYWY